MGYTETFKTVVGISTGAPTAAYFLAGQAKIGTTIYSEECINGNFINLRNILNKTKSAADIGYLCDIFRNSPNKKINIQRLKENPTKMLIGVTNFQTGKGKLIDAKNLQDPILALQASAAIPILYKDKVMVDGVQYLDGALTESFPVEEIIKSERPTSILVFANKSKSFKDTFVRKLFLKGVGLLFPKSLRDGVNLEHVHFSRQLRILRNSRIPYTIVWTDDSIDTLEKDKNKIINGAKNFENYILYLDKLAG